MRHVRARTALGLAIAVPVAIIVSLGCVPALRHDPLYNGEEIVPTVEADTVTFVPITIQNNRSQDAIDPTFYLDGLGRHTLGMVHGLSTRKLLVDKNWFPTDGCMTVVAHWVGGQDWRSEKFCWKKGYVIDISLQGLIRTSNAWAHR